MSTQQIVKIYDSNIAPFEFHIPNVKYLCCLFCKHFTWVEHARGNTFRKKTKQIIFRSVFYSWNFFYNISCPCFAHMPQTLKNFGPWLNICRNPSFGLTTKAKGLQGSGPKGRKFGSRGKGIASVRAKRKPWSHITYSRECKKV